MLKLYIQPLEQRIVRPDWLYRPMKRYTLDQLDEDLFFNKTIANSHGGETPWFFLARMIREENVKAGGWVTLEVGKSEGMDSIWRKAMKLLGNKRFVKFTIKNGSIYNQELLD